MGISIVQDPSKAVVKMRHARLIQPVLLLFFLGTLAFGDPTATILGRVTDPSGAAIAGAAVKVRNEATGIERSTLSTASGDFEINLLPITGRYTLSVRDRKSTRLNSSH